MKKTIILKLLQSVLSGIGLLWLFIESHNMLDSNIWSINFLFFILFGTIVGLFWFFLNGFWIEGFLKKSISITSNAFQTRIKVFYGDLFKQNGYKAIPVNEYFDSIVDNAHVSEKSLHGKMLNNFWSKNILDWDNQVNKELDGSHFVDIGKRSSGGKQKKYEIGATASVVSQSDKFICIALAKTDINNLEASANIEDLQKALKGLLKKARSVCSGEKLNIPLVGSGLSRTGIKINILVDLILLAIFEESKARKITDEINIILPASKKNEVYLSTIKQDWR